MKKYILIVMAMLFPAISFNAFGVENNDSMKLTELWKEYETLSLKDQPQKQLDVLEKIRTQALEKRYAPDYYQACKYTVLMRRRINWKEYDKANDEFDKSVESFGLPVMTMFHKMQRGSLSEAIAYAEQNVSDLKKTNEKWFQGQWMGDSDINSYILDLIDNDCKFAAWAAGLGRVAISENLKSCIGIAYPDIAVFEYVSSDKSKDFLTTHAEKYNGKAAGLLSKGDLLSLEFRDLGNNSKTTAEQYKAFYDKCVAFEKARKAFNGDESKLAKCVTVVESLVNRLEDKSANVRIQDDVLTAELRNLDKLEVVLKKDSKKVWSTTLVNKKNSFYVMDEVKATIPALDDDDYDVEYKVKSQDYTLEYSKHTLSIAARRDVNGVAIYVADYKTGKPLSSVDVSIQDNGKEVKAIKGLTLSGFTYLPSDLVSKSSKNRYNIRCSCTGSDGKVKRSDSIAMPMYYSQDSSVERAVTMGVVFLDRSAFLPGETMQFKGLLYSYDKDGYRVEANKKMSVLLYDAEYNKIAEKKLTTNEFGSVASSFELPKGARNGMFSIEMQYSGNTCGSSGFRVDEFVLPTFDVRFEKIDKLYLEGDTVRIKGWATSYSGHSLASAKVKASIAKGWRGTASDEYDVAVASDGSFELVVENAEEGYYNAEVRVIDSTGETLSFTTSYRVSKEINVDVDLRNAAEASLSNVVSGNVAVLVATAGYDDNILTGNNGPIDVVYRVLDEKEKVVAVGSMKLGASTDVDMSALPSGTYKIVVDATAKKADGSVSSDKSELTIYKVSDNDKAFYSDVESMFRIVGESNNAITLQIASGQGPLWACVEVFGEGGTLLRSEVVNISGKKGENGSSKLMTYGYSDKWPDVVSLYVFYFKNGNCGTYRHEFRRQSSVAELPLVFSRFVDTTMPGTKYSVAFKSNADVEALVSIFDKSTETIMPNYWSKIYHNEKAAPYVSYNRQVGSARTSYSFYCLDDVAYATGASHRVMMSKAAAPMMNASFFEDSIEGEEVSVQEAAAFDAAAEEVTLRENFANTVAFEPFLYSDKNGEVNVEFTTSDKLSTYIFSVFAHDKEAKSAVLRKEFKVTLPIKVAVVEPQLLYVGDHYVVKANLSSTSESAVNGRVALYLYDTDKHETAKPIEAQYAEVSVGAHGAAGVEFEVDVPDVNVLGMKVVFIGKDGETSVSDAVFVPVPVKKATQTIREAHSSIYLAGQDRDGIIAALKGMFVNIPAEDAVLSEKTIMEMVREAIPEKISSDSRDAITLSETLYASVLAKSLGMVAVDGELLERLLKCRNEDGGFGWFEGMASSPMVTAMVLARAASLKERGLDMGIDKGVLDRAVEYLDKAKFGKELRPYWCGGISLEQYLFVRAQYVDVKLAAKPDSDARKEIKTYLVPKKERGMNGQILNKARRLRTLMFLAASEDGVKLANSLGLRLFAEKRMNKSVQADKESLMEYAVAHKSGGKYFPNAVMPFRGLMESELYAHSLLCDLFRNLGEDKLADEIRIWIMVQKETQQWTSDPGYIEAIASVMDGTDEMKETRVLILSGEKEMPFQQVKAAGNGFKVEVLYKREDGTVVNPGDVLSVGDKITSECKIWNEENRSFVHLDVPRPASLRPVDQLSGHIGWWYRPVARSGYSYTPQGYRNVYAGGTEYFFDVYPEEDTTIKESYYVTQAGVFAAPAVVIESLYAPHYVANCEYRGLLQSK